MDNFRSFWRTTVIDQATQLGCCARLFRRALRERSLPRSHPLKSAGLCSTPGRNKVTLSIWRSEANSTTPPASPFGSLAKSFISAKVQQLAEKEMNGSGVN